MPACPRSFRGEQTGADDVLVGAAAAQIAAHRATDVVLRWHGCGIEQSLETHDLAGGAEPALKRVGLNEGLLQRIQPFAA